MRNPKPGTLLKSAEPALINEYLRIDHQPLMEVMALLIRAERRATAYATTAGSVRSSTALRTAAEWSRQAVIEMEERLARKAEAELMMEGRKG